MKQELLAPACWSSEAIEVTLVGCGGTGSSMLDELFRMHSLLTRLDHPGLVVRVWDGDTVSPANVGRQRFWPCDVGWNKAELLVTRYVSFGEVEWSFEPRYFDEEGCQRLRTDILITCVDSPEVRVMIGDTGPQSWAKHALWLDTGNDHDSGQVILGHLGGFAACSGELPLALPNVLDLYPGLRNQRGDDRPSCSVEDAIQRQDFGINQRVAIEASGLLWRLIRYGKLNRHGSYIYQTEGEVLPLSIDEKSWQSFAA